MRYYINFNNILIFLQVDLSLDVITYDSDTDTYDNATSMSGRRRGEAGQTSGGVSGGVARNKKGTPMYSREDIREQYCINDKELHALESSRRKPMFGCLTSAVAQGGSVLPCIRVVF